MKKINVIQFVDSLNTGGAQALIRDYARLIDYNKINLYILTIYPAVKGANVECIKATKAKFISIYPKQTLFYKILFKIAPTLSVSKSLLNILKKNNANVLHVHLPLLKYIMPINEEIKDIKLLYTCHSEPDRMFNSKIEIEAAHKLIKCNSLKFIALHEIMRSEINKKFNIKNTCIIRNGVNFNDYYQLKESKESIKSSFGIPNTAFVVGHIGRFVPVKNHRFLIEVFSEIKKRNANAWLLMVGNGSLVKESMKHIENLGLLSCTIHLENRLDIARILKAMDVFVFPSIVEGLPVSIIEAQVAGIRVVMSDNINEECCFLPSLIRMSIKEPASKWADVAINKDIIGKYDKDITLFDMNKEIRRLENLYLQ